MELSELALISEKYGIKGTIFMIIVIFIYTLLKSTFINRFFTKISDKFVERFMRNKTKDSSSVRMITDSDIINHDIFNYIDFWSYSKVPTIQFSTEYRTAPLIHCL